MKLVDELGRWEWVNKLRFKLGLYVGIVLRFRFIYIVDKIDSIVSFF